VLAEAAAHAAAILILAMVLVMLAAPVGYRLRLWSALTALTKVTALGVVTGGLAAVLALVSLAAGGWRVGPGTTAMLLAIILAGVAAVALPLRVKRIARSLPFNDVSTDTATAPAFEALLPLRRAELPDAAAAYDGAKLAALQRARYPDLAALHLPAARLEAFAQALAAAKGMGWRIVAEDPTRGRIEAYDRTRWYGFIDDIVIRLIAEGAGTRLDMRSASRVGISDLGKNAMRIRRYRAMLERKG
jgi:MFS family permease